MKTILKTALLTTLVTVPLSFVLFHSSVPSLYEMSMAVSNIKELVLGAFDLVACTLVLLYIILKHVGDLGLIARRRK